MSTGRQRAIAWRELIALRDALPPGAERDAVVVAMNLLRQHWAQVPVDLPAAAAARA